MTTSLPLSDNWEFFFKDRWYPARVPGCIHTDLLRNGLIPDPFFGRNEESLQWIEEEDWLYRCRFTAHYALKNEDGLDLVFGGLDTVAEVRFNNQPLLVSENMFLSHRRSIRRLLRDGENELLVRFRSATHYIRTKRTNFIVPTEFNDPVGNCARIRKQQCQFGWDWGPRFVTAGIWKPVTLQAWKKGRISTVRVQQTHRPGSCLVTIDPVIEGKPSLRIEGRVSFEGKAVAILKGHRAIISRPKLWWPAGHGAQPLYTVELELLDGEEVVDRWRTRIGLREVQLDQSRIPGRKGNLFALTVNQRKIFCKGANWIPAHSFVAGLGRADYEPLLRSAEGANMNMLRVWGGGIYEHDCFYEICDELGLMIWQDFMFACTLYPADRSFLQSVTAEVDEQCHRLHPHPSIVLWCGNNEITLLNQAAFREKRKFVRDYKALFLETIPRALRRWDTKTPYLHSSPCDPIEGDKEMSTPSVDAHDWDVWHRRMPLDHYLTKSHAFVSEFGMQSYPSEALALTFATRKDLNIFSPTFENHQKNRAGNQIIFDYLSRRYRFPKDYRALAYLSQLNQSDAMEVAVNHFRRQAPSCMGALYWQLNDCWPVASWSSLEFEGGWKAVHYAAKRFFAPTSLNFVFDAPETLHIGNIYQRPITEAAIWICHDGTQPLKANIDWKLCRLDGRLIQSGGILVAKKEAASFPAGRIPLREAISKHGLHDLYLLATITSSEGELSRKLVTLAPPKLLNLENTAPRWTVKAAGADIWDITLRSKTLLLSVLLELPGVISGFSDNYFDLHPGEARSIRLRSPSLDRESFRNLRIYSIIDSYS